MAVALEEFARWADPAGAKVLAVPVDDAGWHIAKRRPIPPNVVLHRRPPCAPELQPAEPLWPLARGAVAHQGFDGFGAMASVLVARCRWLIGHAEAVHRVVGFGRAVALNG